MGIRAVDVRLEDRGGVMLCGGIKYMYVSRASVEAVRPSAGVVGRSMEVTVMGTRFAVVGTRRAVSCRWSGGSGSRDVEGRVLSSTLVTCQSPGRGHEGSMTVEVSSNGVEYTRGGMAVWYHREARLTVVGPSTGPEAGGTEVRLVGDGMMRGGCTAGADLGQA